MDDNEDTGEWELIHSYTRAEALADGALVDVTEAAREFGYKVPVALTCEAWSLCVALSPAAKRAGNDETGRLRDVLWMSRMMRRTVADDTILFELLCVTERVRPTKVQLKAVCGPGDDAAPVITIMLPNED